MKGFGVSQKETVPSKQAGGFASSGFPQIPPPEFCLLFCRVFSDMLMQSMSLESTRSIPESISPDCSCGGFNVSGFCCIFDESSADSASLMHPSIDCETRSTSSSSCELTTLRRFIDLR